MDNQNEQTLVLIKPDGLKNSLTGYILSQLSGFHTGLSFAAAKIVSVNRVLAAEHYAEHKAKPFFNSVLDYIMGKDHYRDDEAMRRVVAFVYQGKEAIKKVREFCGPTNPHAAREQSPGSIRSLGTLVDVKDAAGKVVDTRIDNLIHASSSTADAEREIKLWFKPNDFPPLMRAYAAEESDLLLYYKDGKLASEYSKGAVCLVAPGDIAWKTDLDALRLIKAGKEAAVALDSIAAKYLINESRG